MVKGAAHRGTHKHGKHGHYHTRHTKASGKAHKGHSHGRTRRNYGRR